MRVISGKAGSIPLKTIKENDTRPTQDRIKETLFNMLGTDVAGAVFLDLFAGSGGIGIEALSRGSDKAYFIDNNPKCIRVINDNLLKTHLKSGAVVMHSDYKTAIGQISEACDYIFVDPPYNKMIEKDVLHRLKGTGLLNENTLIIVEASIDTDLSYVSDLGYEIVRVKNYKTNKHVFLKLESKNE